MALEVQSFFIYHNAGPIQESSLLGPDYMSRAGVSLPGSWHVRETQQKSTSRLHDNRAEIFPCNRVCRVSPAHSASESTAGSFNSLHFLTNKFLFRAK